MKKQFLRVLSILLSLTLFLGIVPTAALTVLAEAVGDALTRVESVVVGDVEVTADNIGWCVEYTGTGDDPFGDMLTIEAANSWTQEDLDSFSWEIRSFVYDENWNEVEVTSGHFEYLWMSSMTNDGDGISSLSPIGQTGALWKNAVNQYIPGNMAPVSLPDDRKSSDYW
jgi:hypothetical protein